MSRAASPLRRAIIVSALAGTATPLVDAQSPAPPKLPLRNLLVELRQGDESRFTNNDAGLHSGAVTVGPDGQVQARGGVTFGTRSRDAAADAVTTLRVRNGGQGMLSVGSSVPVVWYEVLASSDGRGSVLTGQRLQDTGRQVTVRPSWPGGNAPVTVEVRTASSAQAGGGVRSRYQIDGQPLPEGSVDTTGLLTTVQLPLGVWTTVASEATSQVRREQGVVSSSDAERERRHVVQMRVTAP